MNTEPPELPAGPTEQFLESEYGSTWFYDGSEVIAARDKCMALLVALGEKPATYGGGVHESRADAEAYIDALEELGLHVRHEHRDASADSFRDDVAEQYSEEIDSSIDTLVHVADPGQRTEAEIDAMIDDDWSMSEEGRYFGYPEQYIEQHPDETVPIIEAATDHGDADAWHVPALLHLSIPNTEQAYDDVRAIADERYQILQTCAEETDTSLDQQLETLEDGYRRLYE